MMLLFLIFYSEDLISIILFLSAYSSLFNLFVFLSWNFYVYQNGSKNGFSVLFCGGVLGIF